MMNSTFFYAERLHGFHDLVWDKYIKQVLEETMKVLDEQMVYWNQEEFSPSWRPGSTSTGQSSMTDSGYNEIQQEQRSSTSPLIDKKIDMLDDSNGRAKNAPNINLIKYCYSVTYIFYIDGNLTKKLQLHCTSGISYRHSSTNKGKIRVCTNCGCGKGATPNFRINKNNRKILCNACEQYDGHRRFIIDNKGNRKTISKNRSSPVFCFKCYENDSTFNYAVGNNRFLYGVTVKTAEI
ncbi:hypothetical protein BDA99DRAFT_538245 [Phascolomyces articulosus]|uniref:GATA-type domain-containing protein n=1 Tax=Phascolomyces articulosus TaxID=60185 RepID=A0AAD5PDF0_9FUNG|nr:hypothetical protein BDA99DRAFT_538245 [Phascolomyces articulosus]